MRLDYTLYLLAAVFFLITAVSFVMVAEQTEKNLWVVTTVVLGLFSIGLGYNQRPKVKTAVQQPAASIPQPIMPQTPQATTVEAPAIEAPKEEKTEMTLETPKVIEAPAPTPAVPAIQLTQVKGIGEKRATQLKALGINSVDELAKISAEDVAKKLEISPKIVKKWIAGAKELVK
jgi:predicted flap endonuclease-1-like 5' DNA nuclease